MSEHAVQLPLPGFETARAEWRGQYEDAVGKEPPLHNRSGLEIKPLYTSDDWDAGRYMDDLGFPGQAPMTRGIYPSMHRGRAWSQRHSPHFNSGILCGSLGVGSPDLKLWLGPHHQAPRWWGLSEREVESRSGVQG